jgi:L-fuculose-phosphate aldolase
MRLLKENLVSGTWGNISNRLDEQHIIVTPSGKPYDSLVPEDMVVVNIDDLSYEGYLKPSGETSIHAAIYKDRPEINSIVHTHSLYASVIAASMNKVLPYIADMAMILGSDVRVSKHAWTGSQELCETTVEGLKDRFAVILKNHGAICIGRDMEEAFTACQILEKSCQIQLNVNLLSGGKPLSKRDAEAYRNEYLKSYQKK